MKYRLLILPVVIMFACISLNSCKNNSAYTIYVAANGNDENSGDLNNPLLSFDAALSRIKVLINTKEPEQIDVFFRGGTYYFEKPVVLNSQDFGNRKTRINFQAYKNEKPLFSAGQLISGWEKLSDFPENLPLESRDHLWFVDINKLNITLQFKVLFDGENVLYSAISEGFQTTEEEGMETNMLELNFPDGVIKNWDNLEDIEVVLRPQHPWILNILPLKAVDENNGVAELSIPATYKIQRMGWIHTKEANLWVRNAIEYLDEPGEWVMNSISGKLYYWPIDDQEPQDIIIPKLMEIIQVRGNEESNEIIRDIHFTGISFIHGDRDTWNDKDIGLQHDWAMYDKSDALLRFVDTENCSVENCIFSSSGSSGLRFDFYSRNNLIAHNKFFKLGGTAILISGFGPGLKNLSSENQIISNEVFDCGEAYQHSAGIFIWQSGYNRIAHNLIYNQPNSGIVVSGPRPSFFNKGKGNLRELTGTIHFDEIGEIFEWDEMFPYLFARDNVLEYNEIHNVVQDISDGNGIYLSGTGYNTIVRRNYLHDNLSPGFHGIIRGDDMTKDAKIYENIIYRFSNSGIVIKHPNVVVNNYIIDCKPSFTKIGIEVPKAEYILVAPLGPIEGTVIKQNICYHIEGKGRFIKGVFNPNRLNISHLPALTDCVIDSNLYFSRLDNNFEKQFQELKSQGLDDASLLTDPLFFGFDELAFELNKNSPAFQLGIKQIHTDSMGLLTK